MRRFTWFVLGVVVGSSLSRRGAAYWAELKADPIGGADRLIRTVTRIVDGAIARGRSAANTTIEA